MYVYGLYLEGAGWDKKRSNLVESISKMLYDVMPVIHIYAINQPAAKGPDMYQVKLIQIVGSRGIIESF